VRSKKSKEKREKNKQYFRFPSGIKLKLSKDKAAAEEWQDNSKTPLECFHKKFPKKNLKDIDKSSLDWVQKNYLDKAPIVKIKPRDLDKNISKYFKVRDLVKVDQGDKYYMEKAGTWAKHAKFMIYDSGEYYWSVARIDPNLCVMLDDIRKRAGFQFKIDEGVRSYAYNRDMYLAKFGKNKESSPHISGKAVDLQRTGNQTADAKLREAISEALKGKGGGWGYGDNIYHVDVKIQNGNKIDNGNWIIDEKTGKVKLRMRVWPYS